jgi:hypothetical protein
MPKALQDAFVFNSFFGGEPRDWAETPATVSDRFEMPAPTLTEFLPGKLLPSAKSVAERLGWEHQRSAETALSEGTDLSVHSQAYLKQSRASAQRTAT